MLTPTDEVLYPRIIANRRTGYTITSQKTGKALKLVVPKILECGGSRRNTNANLTQGLVPEDIEKTKWFKLIGIYKSPKNNYFNEETGSYETN